MSKQAQVPWVSDAINDAAAYVSLIESPGVSKERQRPPLPLPKENNAEERARWCS